LSLDPTKNHPLEPARKQAACGYVRNMATVPQRGYPLSALFLLMAACAVPMSMAAAAARAASAGEFSGGHFVGAAFIGCMVMMLLGAIVGLHHVRPGLGVIVGGLAGAIVGSLSGPVALAPKRDLPSLVFVSLAGSLAIFLLALWLHASAARHRTPEPPAWLDEGSPFQNKDQAAK
jgi:hypothetical protein